MEVTLSETVALLQKLAAMGDIRALRQELTKIEAMGEQYQAFVMEARRLLEQFRLQALRTLLQEI